MLRVPRGPGWGRNGGNRGGGRLGTELHTKDLIVLQALLFGKISITKSSVLDNLVSQRPKAKENMG